MPNGTYTIERLQELRTQADLVGDTDSRDKLAAMIVEKGGDVPTTEIPEDESKVGRLKRLRQNALNVNDTESAEKLAEMIAEASEKPVAEEAPAPVSPHNGRKLVDESLTTLERNDRRELESKKETLKDRIREGPEAGEFITDDERAYLEGGPVPLYPNRLYPAFYDDELAILKAEREAALPAVEESPLNGGSLADESKTVAGPSVAVGTMPVASVGDQKTTTVCPMDRVSPQEGRNLADKDDDLIISNLGTTREQYQEYLDGKKTLAEITSKPPLNGGMDVHIPPEPPLQGILNDADAHLIGSVANGNPANPQNPPGPPPSAPDSDGEHAEGPIATEPVNNGTATDNALRLIESKGYVLSEIPAKHGRVNQFDVNKYTKLLTVV